MRLKLPSRKALLQQKVTKQKRLDAAVAVQPLLRGNAPRRSVAPSAVGLSYSQPPASVTDIPSSTAAKRSSRLRASSRGILSRVSRLPASARPVQRPALKKFAKAIKGRRVRYATQKPIYIKPRRVRASPSTHLIERGREDLKNLKTLIAQNVTLVSVDTETEQQGLIKRVVEIGISTLNVKDVFSQNVEPGPYADNWISHMNHEHIVVSDTKSPSERMSRSRFGWSTLLSGAEAKEKVLRILKSLEPSSNGTRRIALVGHSLQGDLSMLRRSPALCLDLMDSKETGVEVVSLLDTHVLALSLAESGIPMQSLSLSDVARGMQINPKYLSQRNSDLLGWHNASNDAAYTLMVLLLCIAHQQSTPENVNARPELRSFAIAAAKVLRRKLFAFSRYVVGQ